MLITVANGPPAWEYNAVFKKPHLAVYIVIATFFCCFSVAAVSDNKDKPISGCHPILMILGDDQDPSFGTDCTQCIDCTVHTAELSCSASATCSDDSINCTESEKCPILSCNCGQVNGSCDCECTGNGVECSWTDSKGIFHEITKNCPDNLP